MKILIDMNLSPMWVEFFRSADIESIHWSAVGDPTAPDTALMQWAVKNDCIVFTHDLDFGALLAISQSSSPSVLQVRIQNCLPDTMGGVVLLAMQQFAFELEAGALLTINANKTRVRILPF